MNRRWILCTLTVLLVAVLSACSQTIIAPEDLTVTAGESVKARQIAYQDPMWPNWGWWQRLTSTNPTRWDVVVFRPDPQTTDLRALRVVGLPGEALRIENGRVLANDQPVAVPEPLKPLRYESSSVSVPQDHYFLLSDDPGQTNDSRKFGSVHRKAIRSRIDSVERRK